MKTKCQICRKFKHPNNFLPHKKVNFVISIHCDSCRKIIKDIYLKQQKRLTSIFIKKLLNRCFHIPLDQITPDLITAKRNQLLLHRTVKKANRLLKETPS
jgi:hypothetical protein